MFSTFFSILFRDAYISKIFRCITVTIYSTSYTSLPRTHTMTSAKTWSCRHVICSYSTLLKCQASISSSPAKHQIFHDKLVLQIANVWFSISQLSCLSLHSWLYEDMQLKVAWNLAPYWPPTITSSIVAFCWSGGR